MPNPYFQFKQFKVEQAQCAMKVTTDASVFGAWVAEQLRKQGDRPVNILDIGTGTGLLSLMLAQALPKARIIGVEIDPEAAAEATRNVQNSPWHDRIEIRRADILDDSLPHTFDHIVSNPPFYEQDLTGPDNRKNQAFHQSSLSFESWIRCLDRDLSEEGNFFVLLPDKRTEERMTLLEKKGYCVQKQVDLFHESGRPRLRVFLSGNQGPQKPLSAEPIYIQQQEGQYSGRIRELLRDYYLAF